MSKNIFIAVFCIVALILCYKVEQSVYQTKTYSYYKSLTADMQDSLLVQDTDAKQSMQDNVLEENEKEAEIKKVAYLTFDDGPSKITKDVLKVLKDEDVRATFFIIGSQITEDTEPVLKEMIDNGNVIGVHTYSHVGKSIYKSPDAYFEDFTKACDKIKEVTGMEPKILRFPWGSTNSFMSNYSEKIISELELEGFTYYDWNVSAEDSVGKPTEYSILHNIEKDYKKYKQPVILMHDSAINKLTAKVLPKIIKELKEEGYSFDTLDHMETPYQFARD
ncbi:polysaccharide deacetylase family protein [Anaeromicropila populeti]|uniref:Peptidoglycan/xylan/chitin deacetylase, PgdA/CDA1 family n=1 Tax=Anaeromicropila populeti TaxID=37658 RepID=A0A1I6KRF8_9FIRM|nr:polysaccharide deacetylase family protein [Anaeromicropila populeti]SFR93791.1 Peptidoglycan/xylan/chitin deacetylase, PgdA/CDA1 family [Anaeromicropila populeti]